MKVNRKFESPHKTLGNTGLVRGGGRRAYADILSRSPEMPKRVVAWPTNTLLDSNFEITFGNSPGITN